MALDIVITLVLVLLNGFFVAAEFAIVKVRASQIELRIRTGSKLALVSRHLIEHLDSYLSATQLGITFASLGLGWIGEPVVSKIIIGIMTFAGIDIAPELAHQIALPIAFALITVLHIVFGELAPKSLAIQRSEQVTLAIAIPLRVFYVVFKPFIWSLNSLANRMIKSIGFEPISEEEELHSSEELRYLIEESGRSGVIGTSEHKMLENVFEFAETPVKQIMVPRGRIFGIEVSTSIEEIIEIFIEDGFSRMPVYERTSDNILGIVYAKDIISMMQNKDLIIIQDIIRPAYFVNEDEKINKLLTDMQRNRVHVAIVLDDFGGIAGLVSLEDIIEEIVGEIQDEYDEEAPIIQKINDTDFVVSAAATIDDANDFLPVNLPDDEDYETVGGLIISNLGRIPETNELIELDDYFCKILKRSKRAVETVKLMLKEQPADDDEIND